MSAVKMTPVIPVPKRATGFSIESIMRKEEKRAPDTSEEDSESGDDVPRRMTPTDPGCNSRTAAARIPPLHPALPPHVQQLLLREPRVRGSTGPPERPPAFAFGPQQLNVLPALGINPGLQLMGYSPQYAPTSGALSSNSIPHPGILAVAAAAAGRDPLSVYSPWGLNKYGTSGVLGYPVGELNTPDF